MPKIKSIITKVGILSLIILTTASCIVTKKYKTPEISKDHYLFRLDSLSGNGQEIGKQNWKEFFKDPILISYIDSALIYNADNSLAVKNIEKFQARFKQGKAGYLPTLTVNTSAQRQKQAGNSQFGSFFSKPFTQYDFSGQLSWEADLWGKITSQKLASEARFEKSITAQKTVQTTIIANVANTYYKLLEADQRKRLLLETVRVREESVRTLQALKENGEGNILAVTQAEAQLSQSKVLLTNVENQIFDLENALVVLIGKTVPFSERGNLDEQQTPNAIQLSMPFEALSNRPDVKEAELDFRSFFEEFNVSKASMYPTLKLSANGGFQSLALSSWFNYTSLFNTLTAGITQPIFNNRKLKTQKEVAKIEMEQSLIRFQQKVLDASTEVSNALLDYETSTTNLKLLNEQEQILNQSFKHSKALLQAGMANYLDVLNAQGNLLNTQLQHIQTKSQHLQNAVTIYRAVGGGTN